MTEKQPSLTHEHEQAAEPNPFSIDTLANTDIIEIGRTLAAAADELDDESAQATKLDALWEKLQEAVKQLPARNIDRARQLLSEQMASGNTHDLEAAAEWVEGFLEHDYELARDTLVRIYADRSLSGRGRGVAFDIVAQKLGSLKDRLTPEQQADFDTKLGEYDDRYDPTTPVANS